MPPQSIDELRSAVATMKAKGLNSQQIADELSLSQTTIQWLSSTQPVEDHPADIRVGWRSIAVKGERIEAVSEIFADIMLEEVEEEVDSIVGISINGIPFATCIASGMDLELSVARSISEEEGGHLSEVFAGVEGKRVVVIDDVVSSGLTMRKTIEHLTNAGAKVLLCLVLVNKTWMDEIDGIPLRALVRAARI
jgi:orotate phosphoribosyltransferase